MINSEVNTGTTPTSLAQKWVHEGMHVGLLTGIFEGAASWVMRSPRLPRSLEEKLQQYSSDITNIASTKQEPDKENMSK